MTTVAPDVLTSQGFAALAARLGALIADEARDRLADVWRS